MMVDQPTFPREATRARALDLLEFCERNDRKELKVDLRDFRNLVEMSSELNVLRQKLGEQFMTLLMAIRAAGGKIEIFPSHMVNFPNGYTLQQMPNPQTGGITLSLDA